MILDDLMVAPGANIYYDDSFRSVLEDHMTYLRSHPSTEFFSIDVGKAYKYEYDFNGLLRKMNIPDELHWVTMRVNKMTSPLEFDMTMEALLVPNRTVLEQIRQSHMSKRRVT